MKLLPLLYRRRARRQAAGQALVEFAIILPLLLLLLVLAIDFGRVFFGWVALNNAARIGADWAAGHAGAWDGTPDSTDSEWQQRYEELVLNDLQGLRCAPALSTVDDPDFYQGFDDGDLVRVSLSCGYPLITPLAREALGGPLVIGAEADFAIHRTITAGVPPPPPPPPPPCDPPVADFTTTPPADASGVIEGDNALVVSFTNTSTVDAACDDLEWEWKRASPEAIFSTDENPLLPETFTNLGPSNFKTYTVTLTVTDEGGTSTESVSIRVRKP